MKKLMSVLFFTLISIYSFCGYAQSVEIHPIKIPGLIATANKLDNTGIVKQQSASHRYIYLAISAAHVNKLYPILRKNLPFIMRHCLRQDKNSIGAHITLFEPEDITASMWLNINKLLLGKSFKFKINNAKILFMKKRTRKEIVYETWYVISISAPKLKKVLDVIKPGDPYFNDLHYSVAVSRQIQGHCAQ